MCIIWFPIHLQGDSQVPITMAALVFAGTDLLISLGRCEKRNTCKKEAKHASMKNIAEFLIWRLQHVLAEFIKKAGASAMVTHTAIIIFTKEKLCHLSMPEKAPGGD